MTDVPATKTSLATIDMQSRGDGVAMLPANLGQVVQFAEVMCKADIALPQHLRGNAGACLAVSMRAFNWEMEPFAVASKTYMVSGQIAYEAQLVAAVINTRAPITKRPKYEFMGEPFSTRQCKVTFETRDGETYEYISPQTSKILPKNSPLWKTDEDQQLGYYSVRAGARRYFPEVIMGVYTPEEMVEHVQQENGRATSFATMEAKAAEVTQEPAIDAEVEEISPQPIADAAGAADPAGSAQPASTESPSSPAAAVTGAAEASASDAPSGFIDYAEALAEASDWPEIDLALATLRKSPEWANAAQDQQLMARRIAYIRLKELVDGGYKFDFLSNMQAWRCYIEFETDTDALTGNRRAMSGTAEWMALSTQAKVMLDSAFDARITYLRANPPVAAGASAEDLS